MPLTNLPHYSTFAPDSQRFVLENVMFTDEIETWKMQEMGVVVGGTHAGVDFEGLVAWVDIPDQRVVLQGPAAPLLDPEHPGPVQIQAPFCHVHLNGLIAEPPPSWETWPRGDAPRDLLDPR